MLIVDTKNDKVIIEKDGESITYDIGSPEAFYEISKVYLRAGWDSKYVYSLTWLGRPVIQLPDDMIRLQEVIYKVKPDVIIEIGVAHGGSLIFSASLCHAIGKGQVIGIDIEIRPHNRVEIENHRMNEYISLIEGDSVAEDTIRKVEKICADAKSVIVFLDGCHTKDHVLKELELYSKFITVDSYIVAMDGIQKDLVGAPRSEADWAVNNPSNAALEFVEKNESFIIEEPEMPFNEGLISKRMPTYWPNAFIKRINK